jgi:hypothetical protein
MGECVNDIYMASTSVCACVYESAITCGSSCNLSFILGESGRTKLPVSISLWCSQICRSHTHTLIDMHALIYTYAYTRTLTHTHIHTLTSRTQSPGSTTSASHSHINTLTLTFTHMHTLKLTLTHKHTRTHSPEAHSHQGLPPAPHSGSGSLSRSALLPPSACTSHA